MTDWGVGRGAWGVGRGASGVAPAGGTRPKPGPWISLLRAHGAPQTIQLRVLRAVRAKGWVAALEPRVVRRDVVGGHAVPVEVELAVDQDAQRPSDGEAVLFDRP